MEYLNRNVDLAKNVESKFPGRQIKVVEDRNLGIINFLAIDKLDPTFWNNIAQLKQPLPFPFTTKKNDAKIWRII